jgi:hypothetical protein
LVLLRSVWCLTSRLPWQRKLSVSLCAFFVHFQSVCEKKPSLFSNIMYILTRKEKVSIYDHNTLTGNSQSAIFSSLKVLLFYWNPVRFIDAFVEVLALQTVRFSVQTIKGRSWALILKYFLKYICRGV